MCPEWERIVEGYSRDKRRGDELLGPTYRALADYLGLKRDRYIVTEVEGGNFFG